MTLKEDANTMLTHLRRMQFEMSNNPAWLKDEASIYKELARRLSGTSMSPKNLRDVITKFGDSQQFLSESVRYSKDLSATPTEAELRQIVPNLIKDLEAAAKSMGGRRTRRTRKHRSRSRKYRSRR